ncbi:hypothetical protein [Pantoea sp. 18069]|uniref:hypothetical protein n=1 Tax=Pantoea sp. 18069 TaxID=2681415 RepID=UPI001359F9A4|nr:hypothetical protein [Pantoea sp. 18069]
MDLITTAMQWALRHPWMVLGALVVLGCAIRWMNRPRKDRRPRPAATPLLRSRKEQQRFSHLSTVYAPKSHRRQRPPRN